MTDNPDLTQPEIDAVRSWSNVGAPGPAPEEPFVPSPEQLAGMSPMLQPRTVSVAWTLTPDDRDRLLWGHRSMAMEDKWNIFASGERIHFHRSWTGHEVFQFAIGGGLTVNSFQVEADAVRYRAATDIARTDGLLEVLEAVCGVKPRRA